MAQKKLSELDAADALLGTEVLAVVQGGATDGATIDQIKTFVGAPEELDDLPDVDLTTAAPTDQQVLVFDSGSGLWVPADQGGGAESLDELSDVDLTTTAPVSGDTLTFDGTNWVPVDVIGDHVAESDPHTQYAELSGGADANFTAMPQIAGDSFVWATKAIGEPFGIRDDWVGTPIPPTGNPNFRFIKLTAGEDGVGEFNEGLLVSESVSGSAPLVVATAVIDHAASPINGETVNLWNTEGRYGKPGTSPGTVANDQMQQITGTFGNVDGSLANASGAFSIGGDQSDGHTSGATSKSIGFDSANSPDARTGTYTDVKHQQLTYYMRIA